MGRLDERFCFSIPDAGRAQRDVRHRMSSVFSRLTAFARRHPFATAVTVGSVNAGAADFAVQRFVEKKEHVDWRRVSTFFTFGFCFCGMWEFTFFVKIMPRLFPGAERFAALPLARKMKDGQGLRSLFAQTAIDNFLNTPLLYFPSFYFVKELLGNNNNNNKEPPPSKSKTEQFSRAMHTYRSNCVEDLVASWTLYIPLQVLNLGFSPLWLRVPVIAAVSVLWTMYLSATRGHD